MKKIILITLALALVVCAFTACAPEESLPTAKASAAPAEDKPDVPTKAAVAEEPAAIPTITVVGTGKMDVEPDMVTLNLGVIAYGNTAAEATQINADTMEKVKKAVLDFGVSKEDIKTQNVSVYPQSYYDEQTFQSVVTGYSANNSLEVKFYDIEKAGDLLDTAVAAGAGEVYGVYFGLKDANRYSGELAKLAAEDANAQAQAYAAAFGKTLGEIVTISTGVNYNEPVLYANVESPAPAADIAMSKSSTVIESGKLSLSENVTVKYVIK